MTSLKSVQCIRERASTFCRQRQWERFHVPMSLALALAGECGEVCEIFQWKETMLQQLNAGESVLASKEIEHIGEELADVLIYTTRLCDVCAIDLAHSVRCVLEKKPFLKLRSTEEPWEDLSFDELERHPVVRQPFESHRTLALRLQGEVGRLCHLFSQQSEVRCPPGLPSWSIGELEAVSTSLGTIVLLLCTLAHMTGIRVGTVVADKFAKNAAKYPAEQAKGSSAKYTSYSTSATASCSQSHVWPSNQKLSSLSVVLLVGVVSFVLGSRMRAAW